MGCGTVGSGDDTVLNTFGLYKSHAYTTLGTFRNVDGWDLVKVRNPHSSESYWGNFSDDSDLWTDSMKQQVGWTAGNDGVFFMDKESYHQAFSDTQTNFYREGAHINWYLVENDTTAAKRWFKIVNPTAQRVFVSQDTWGERIYPDGCADTSLQFLAVWKGSTRLEYSYRWDQLGTHSIDLGVLEPGAYDIEVDPQWGAGTVPDYTVRTYAFDHPLRIQDANGQTNEVNEWNSVHSTTFAETVSKDLGLALPELVAKHYLQ